MSKVAKIRGVFSRARVLRRFFRQVPAPHVLLSASRSSALVARWMGIPSFVIADYEYANSSFYRLTRSTILHPDVIDPKAFFASGVDSGRLIPFSGLKEDISLGSVDLKDVVPHRFPQLENDALVRVLFRPPAEMSHYYKPESRDLALHALGRPTSRNISALQVPERVAAGRLGEVLLAKRAPRPRKAGALCLPTDGSGSGRLLWRNDAQGSCIPWRPGVQHLEEPHWRSGSTSRVHWAGRSHQCPGGAYENRAAKGSSARAHEYQPASPRGACGALAATCLGSSHDRFIRKSLGLEFARKGACNHLCRALVGPLVSVVGRSFDLVGQLAHDLM